MLLHYFRCELWIPTERSVGILLQFLLDLQRSCLKLPNRVVLGLGNREFCCVFPNHASPELFHQFSQRGWVSPTLRILGIGLVIWKWVLVGLGLWWWSSGCLIVEICGLSASSHTHLSWHHSAERTKRERERDQYQILVLQLQDLHVVVIWLIFVGYSFRFCTTSSSWRSSACWHSWPHGRPNFSNAWQVPVGTGSFREGYQVSWMLLFALWDCWA